MGEMNSSNGKAPRAITFPKTSAGVWTNHETGVMIRLELDGSGYRAFRPALGMTVLLNIRQAMRTLAEARDAAASYVTMVARPEIAKAAADALAEDHLRTIDAVADAAMAAVRENDHAEALEIDAEQPIPGTRLDRLVHRANYDTLVRVERELYALAWRAHDGTAVSLKDLRDALGRVAGKRGIRDEWIERSALGDLDRLVRRTSYDALARVARELDSLQELADGGDTVSFADMRAALDDIAGLRGIRDEWAARG